MDKKNSKKEMSETSSYFGSQNVFTKEENISSQIKTAIQKVSLPDDWADWMISELEKEKQAKAQSSIFFAQKTNEDISKLDEKLEKLMNAYLENALSLEEYRESKNKLINKKQVLKDKINAFEQKSNNRFELSIKFIQTSKEAKIIALQENPERIRDFLKKIGSNFRIAEQNLNFDFKNAWKMLAKIADPALAREAANPKNFNFEKLRASSV